MITIRLQRHGRKNDPSFRVIVVDSKKKPKTGNYLEMVGFYDARVDRTELKGERIKHWMLHGATVSDTVHNLLVSKKIIDAKKINVLPKKTPQTRVTESQNTQEVLTGDTKVSQEDSTHSPKASNEKELQEKSEVAPEEVVG